MMRRMAVGTVMLAAVLSTAAPVAAQAEERSAFDRSAFDRCVQERFGSLDPNVLVACAMPTAEACVEGQFFDATLNGCVSA